MKMFFYFVHNILAPKQHSVAVIYVYIAHLNILNDVVIVDSYDEDSVYSL
jgi:hypothetical protein